MTPEEFVKSTKYLPPPLRDFHDQKRLFKRIWRNVENKKRKEQAENVPYSYFEGMDWVKAHVFVIDFFLWFMALHGYTLQKSRQPIKFYDFGHAMEAFDKELMEEQMEMIERVKKEKPT